MLHKLQNAPMVDMSIFLIITFTSILRFFVCCWSAQAVIDMVSPLIICDRNYNNYKEIFSSSSLLKNCIV